MRIGSRTAGMVGRPGKWSPEKENVDDSSDNQA
jgi:hypothetical protein